MRVVWGGGPLRLPARSSYPPLWSRRRPGGYALAQSYPNPFNTPTVIRFDLRADEPVRIGVYDMLGRDVMVLLGDHHQAGSHAISVDAARLATWLSRFPPHPMLSETIAEAAEVFYGMSAHLYAKRKAEE